MESLVGFTPDIRDFDCDGIFQFPRPLALRYADRPSHSTRRSILYLLERRHCRRRADCGRKFQVHWGIVLRERPDPGEHGITMTVTDRFESDSLLALSGVVWPRVDHLGPCQPRQEGDARREGGTGKQSTGDSLNMVSVVSERIVIGDVASSQWLEGARLVAFDFAGDHNVERSLDQEPFRFTYMAPEESKYRSKKAR